MKRLTTILVLCFVLIFGTVSAGMAASSAPVNSKSSQKVEQPRDEKGRFIKKDKTTKTTKTTGPKRDEKGRFVKKDKTTKTTNPAKTTKTTKTTGPARDEKGRFVKKN